MHRTNTIYPPNDNYYWAKSIISTMNAATTTTILNIVMMRATMSSNVVRGYGDKLNCAKFEFICE